MDAIEGFFERLSTNHSRTHLHHLQPFPTEILNCVTQHNRIEVVFIGQR